MRNQILIIDDEIKLRSLMARILERENYTVVQAGDFKAAFKLMEQQHFPVVICDVKLPDGNGVEKVPIILQEFPGTLVILLTAYGNIADGVRAIKNGAFDYITKGDDNDKIIPLINSAFGQVALRDQILQKEPKDAVLIEIVGNSPAIKNAVELARKVSPTDATVLLTGETGTGKEVFAQAIHQNSRRKEKPFVALNCSTFSREIMESELFGHAAGAFTGALKDKKGIVAEADGGTLFLDEIGELPLELQAKLLRLLETKEYFRVGDTKPLKSDFRLIAATNRYLEQESENGRFRTDLYFRLNIFEIHLPSLRERLGDVPALAHVLLAMGNHSFTPDNDYLKVLQQWHWPGNVRELKNVLERSSILASGNILTVETLPLEMVAHTTADNKKPLSAFSMQSVEKLHIQKVLNYTNGNKTEAARLLEIGTATLYRKIEEYRL